jgi:hypothetical protein
MDWIIENITKEPSFLALSDAAKAAGHRVMDIRGDFTYSMIRDYRSRPVVFNGSIEMVKHITPMLLAQECGPVSYCTWENYLCSKYYTQLAPLLFNHEFIFVPLCEIIRRPYFFWGALGEDGMLFVRPDSGDKTFKGTLLDIQYLERWYDVNYANDMAVVARPRNIMGEWRFVVTREGEIVAVSSYRYQGLCTRVPSAPVGATELVKKVLKIGYHPDSVYCIDIAQSKAGEFGVMELTSFSSAGLYACDPKAVVETVSRMAEKDYYANQTN